MQTTKNDSFREEALSLISSVRRGWLLKAKTVRSTSLWLAGVLLYGNHQRPGGISNAKLTEHNNANIIEEERETLTLTIRSTSGHSSLALHITTSVGRIS